MDVSTEDLRYVSLMELLYADDLALCGNELVAKYKRWRRILSGKDLRVNAEKTKGIQFFFGKKAMLCYAKVDPCDV